MTKAGAKQLNTKKLFTHQLDDRVTVSDLEPDADRHSVFKSVQLCSCIKDETKELGETNNVYKMFSDYPLKLWIILTPPSL